MYSVLRHRVLFVEIALEYFLNRFEWHDTATKKMRFLDSFLDWDTFRVILTIVSLLIQDINGLNDN